jgi:hypothetical protein
MYVLIDCAATHGVPGCAGDWSNTVPLIMALVPEVMAACGAETVVAL